MATGSPSRRRQIPTPTITFGAFCVIPSSLMAEGLGHAGLDWVCIDRQHGLIAFDAMVTMLQGLSITGTPTFVRVSENSAREIGGSLDAGASGVIVPMVNSRTEAAKAVRAVRYPPVGERSWGPTRLAFGGPEQTHRPEPLLFVMLETREAFEHARSIVAVPGIDGVFVGPSDLALSLGLQPGDVLHTEVRRRCTELAELCSEFGVVAAIGSHTLDQARTWLAAGFQMLSIGRDLTMMTDRMGERLAQLRGA